MVAGIPHRGYHALHPAGAKASGYDDTLHRFQISVGAVLLHVLGAYPCDFYVMALRQGGVDKSLLYGQVRVAQINVFADYGHSQRHLRLFDLVHHSAPCGQIPARIRYLERIQNQISQALVFEN